MATRKIQPCDDYSDNDWAMNLSPIPLHFYYPEVYKSLPDAYKTKSGGQVGYNIGSTLANSFGLSANNGADNTSIVKHMYFCMTKNPQQYVPYFVSADLDTKNSKGKITSSKLFTKYIKTHL